MSQCVLLELNYHGPEFAVCRTCCGNYKNSGGVRKTTYNETLMTTYNESILYYDSCSELKNANIYFRY